LYHNFASPLLIPFLSLSISLAFVSVANASDADEKPIIFDSNLKVEQVYSGLDVTTTMAFIGPDDILVLEKNNGTVQRIINGNKLSEPILDVDVSYAQERGMLGIAIAENETNNSNTYVFLYYTKSETNGDENIYNSTYSVSNHLYRYELVNHSKLQNPKLLLSTPSAERPYHQGGKLVIGPNHNIYATIGDQNAWNTTQAQNFKNGAFPDTTGGILRITLDGLAPSDDILGEKLPFKFVLRLWHTK
jgi:aldose sugar dehydrogenase